MIIVKITMHALEEKRNEVYLTLLSLIDAIREEKGCMGYQVFQDLKDENIFCLVVKWSTREDLERHMKSDVFGVLLGAKILLIQQQDIQIHTVLLTEGKEAVDAVRGQRF